MSPEGLDFLVDALDLAAGDLEGGVGNDPLEVLIQQLAEPKKMAVAGGLADVHAELLMRRYQVDVAGAYHAIQQVLGEEFSKKSGTILVTGGGFGLYPMDEFLPLSMDEAALRAMCIALHNKLKEQNVYVGTLTVTDSIIPGTRCDPALLAEDFWKMYVERGECELMH